MAADIIVYALIAAGLVFWLRNILGTRHGGERKRPNPLAMSPEIKNKSDLNPGISAEKQSITGADLIKDLAQNPYRGFVIDNKSAENGLLEIIKQDQNFDIKEFLGAAQDVFAYVVEAFGQGDREILKDLLGEEVFTVFDEAIQDREKREETLETQIQSVNEARIIETSLKDKTAFITVRFEAQQTIAIKDSEGEIISGHPDKISKMIDIWTFSRNLKSKDLRWLVSETRGDFEDDNDTIPDSV